ncbi:hypothetical protein FB567DRAFT_304641 [Paraphoma chrysanthemicola]|uniref:Mediator of RNA polymerase II transcription subunit 6 n=1 Tax=Paraphoma chrysanthemicola TaxID=798071 RepID=A0A8K0RB65_9PLEO|nr:hypothetical protein FB567DRAFT_304641 [Paraphoma chrysanthemicola]
MASKVPLLDEQDYNFPPALEGLEPGGIDAANNLMWYFFQSQFYEPQSNNTAVLNFHRDDPGSHWVINDRKEFDNKLRSIGGGLQFVIAGEPQGEGQPWLLQRQMLIRRDKDHVDRYCEGNWYNQGTRILMAPSMLDVVRARLLTISTRLQQVAETSQNMTYWSPSTGYSYMPPSYEAPKAAAAGSRIGSPTLAPTELDQSQGTAAAQAVDALDSETEFSDALFMQSLNLTNQYGDEYMDENPLKGEPGAFVFTNTKNAVDERNKAQEKSAEAASAQLAAQKAETRPSSVAPSVAPTPKGAATPAAIEGHSRKGSVAPSSKDKKRERRKSKGLASPTTPGVPPTG